MCLKNGKCVKLNVLLVKRTTLKLVVLSSKLGSGWKEGTGWKKDSEFYWWGDRMICQRRVTHIYTFFFYNSSLVRMDSQNPDALLLRARVFYGQGDNAKTAAHCTEALRCDPDFAKARTLLKKARSIEAKKEAGNTAFKSNQLQEAYDAYTAALELDPENSVMNAKLYSNRAAVLQKVKTKTQIKDKGKWVNGKKHKKIKIRLGNVMCNKSYLSFNLSITSFS